MRMRSLSANARSRILLETSQKGLTMTGAGRAVRGGRTAKGGRVGVARGARRRGRRA